MNRRGFALITVLWLVAIMAALVGAASAAARDGAQLSANRAALTRAAWAREACAEILLARFEPEKPLAGIDTLDLGRGTWCRVTMDDPTARLHLNRADPEALRLVLGADSLRDALLDWTDADDLPRPRGAEAAWYRAARRPAPRNSPIADVSELRLVRGFDSAAVERLTGLLTTRGTGAVNLNLAPVDVLAGVPGMSPEVVGVLVRRREAGRPVASLDDLGSDLSAAGRADLHRHYQTLATRATFAPQQLVARVEGGVAGSPVRAVVVLTALAVPGRLAVIRRETE